MIRCALSLLALLLLVGCDGTEGDRLFGSAARTFNLDFTFIRIEKQVVGGVFDAMIVKYVNKPKPDSSEHWPVKVVANAPIEEGKEKDLVASDAGSVERLMPDGSQFDPMLSGVITFFELGDVGQKASGEFFITFDNSKHTTLNGVFSGTVELVGSE